MFDNGILVVFCPSKSCTGSHTCRISQIHVPVISRCVAHTEIHGESQVRRNLSRPRCDWSSGTEGGSQAGQRPIGPTVGKMAPSDVPCLWWAVEKGGGRSSVGSGVVFSASLVWQASPWGSELRLYLGFTWPTYQPDSDGYIASCFLLWEGVGSWAKVEVSFKTAAFYRKHSCSIIRVMITLAAIVHSADQMIFKVRVRFHSNGGKKQWN